VVQRHELAAPAQPAAFEHYAKHLPAAIVEHQIMDPADLVSTCINERQTDHIQALLSWTPPVLDVRKASARRRRPGPIAQVETGQSKRSMHDRPRTP
jgi:hypothetical protein